jgi:hypothetical protein
MKKVSFSRLLLSITLIAFLASTVSFAFTGSPVEIVKEAAAVLFGIGFIYGLVKIQNPLPTSSAFNFTVSDTTYAGEVASQFVVKAITGNDTINKGLVYVKDGIKKKYTIPRYLTNYEDFIQDRQATPVSKGAATIDAKVLDPQDLMIYWEFNPRDFEDHWYAVKQSPKLLDRALPATVESVVVQEAMKNWAKYFNKAIWNNDTTLSSIYKYWDGFIPKALADSDVVDVSSPLTLDATNVIAELLRGYALIPTSIKFDSNMKLIMSPATFDLYDTAVTNQTYKGNDVTEIVKEKFKGIKIVVVNDLPSNFYLFTRATAGMDSNLWVGLNSIADEGLQLARLQANSELFFIKMLIKADVQTAFGSEIVMYKA